MNTDSKQCIEQKSRVETSLVFYKKSDLDNMNNDLIRFKVFGFTFYN